MSIYVISPGCDRLMLGQRRGDETFAQPHECKREAGK